MNPAIDQMIEGKFKNWFVENQTTFSFINKEKSKEMSTRTRSKIKQCYHNCFRGLWRCDLKYFEGYVWSKAIPIPLDHCWLVNEKGEVIDPTLIISTKQKGGEDRTKDCVYTGVEMQKDWLYKKCFNSMKTGPYLLDYYSEKMQID